MPGKSTANTSCSTSSAGRSAQKSSRVVPMPCSSNNGSPDPVRSQESRVLTSSLLPAGEPREARFSTQGVHRHSDSDSPGGPLLAGSPRPWRERLPRSGSVSISTECTACKPILPGHHGHLGQHSTIRKNLPSSPSDHSFDRNEHYQSADRLQFAHSPSAGPPHPPAPPAPVHRRVSLDQGSAISFSSSRRGSDSRHLLHRKGPGQKTSSGDLGLL